MAQDLSATDTSERSVKRYQNIINTNKQLVRFIEYSFISRGIPKHMRNLAIIESSLDQSQVSAAGAAGVWQFMTGHANDYGLTETDRSDMFKSTKAVTNSLINLYNKYHNWVTVVAAYNCGEGNINRAIQKAGSKNYTDFRSFLPTETQNHVQKYLNACYATGELDAVLSDYYKTSPTKESVSKKPTVDYEKFKANTLKNQDKIDLVETSINGAFQIDAILRYISVDKTQFLKWNPDIEKNLGEKGESVLILPREMMDKFTINKYRILTESLKK
ncbi:lytic transglycosylase domain-containing protein [Halpernia frigidisoli]|uniref:lytic transglycosylase domain-containing protein n=1 Tax=Halpernia frigidisoli TaxID=1125876 RepID=UPI000A52B023|nr:lytic transglycosylase domain-containing protein [Halpernia frigidisoli]